MPPAAAPIPKFLYGTAWKEERSQALTTLALRAGFRAIDTANQRKHYFELAVAAAVKDALASGLVTRAELFLQTKFTFQGGQDQRLPYDPKARIATQVEQSFTSSLQRRAMSVPANICTPWGAPGSTCSSVGTPASLRRNA